MYRVDAVWDRIYFDTIESDNAINNFKESLEKVREKFFTHLFKNFKEKQTQIKINKLINQAGAIEELKLMFDVIDKRVNAEREDNEMGLASHLLALMLSNLEDSEQLWKNMIKLIVLKDTVALDKFIKRSSVMNAISSVLQNYLNSMCQIGDEFFIDTDDDTNPKFFASIEVSHMIIVIHHLLNHPKTTAFIHNQIFNVFDLSPSFINFLKRSLRNLSL